MSAGAPRPHVPARPDRAAPRIAALRRALLAIPLGVGACGGDAPPPFGDPTVLGGVAVPAATLERGRAVYRRHCRDCHGEGGAGDGPAAAALPWAPPDLRAGAFRHKSAPGDALPTHDELVAVIAAGVPARGMPGWGALPVGDLDAVAHYLKTFSPRWLRTGHGAAAPPAAGPKK